MEALLETLMALDNTVKKQVFIEDDLI